MKWMEVSLGLLVEVELDRKETCLTPLIMRTKPKANNEKEQKDITGIGHMQVHLSKIAIFLSTQTALISSKKALKLALYATILVN